MKNTFLFVLTIFFISACSDDDMNIGGEMMMDTMMMDTVMVDTMMVDTMDIEIENTFIFDGIEVPISEATISVIGPADPIVFGPFFNYDIEFVGSSSGGERYYLGIEIYVNNQNDDIMGVTPGTFALVNDFVTSYAEVPRVSNSNFETVWAKMDENSTVEVEGSGTNYTVRSIDLETENGNDFQIHYSGEFIVN